jgi:hypothetical protein
MFPHDKRVSCHHGMARPPVAETWRSAADILNKQSRTADMGRPSSLRVGRGANNTHRKKYVAKYLHPPRKWTVASLISFVCNNI